MTGIRDIKKKMGSVSSTRKITSAMEKVAASKMRKSQDRMLSARPYADAIRNIMRHISSGNPEYVPELMQVREQHNNVVYIVVSSDKGLCGGLNLNLFKSILLHIQAKRQVNSDYSPHFCTLGTKATGYFRSIGMPIVQSAQGAGTEPKAETVVEAVREVTQAYARKEVDAVYLCFNEFTNTMTQTPMVDPLLPLVADTSTESGEPESGKSSHWDYLYEPEAAEILDAVVQRYIESVVYRSVVENFACEQAAKMLAMKSATDNASDLIDQLSLAYNNARQAAITKELSEIIGGAEAV